jgi:WD40 repeat protein
MENSLICSAISSNGRWICASDGSETRIYYLDYDENDKPTVTRDRSLPEDIGCQVIAFTPDSSRLILGGNDSTIYVFALNLGGITCLSLLEYHNRGLEGTEKWTRGGILTLAISSDSQWLVSGDHLNRIVSYSLDTLEVHLFDAVACHSPKL